MREPLIISEAKGRLEFSQVCTFNVKSKKTESRAETRRFEAWEGTTGHIGWQVRCAGQVWPLRDGRLGL